MNDSTSRMFVLVGVLVGVWVVTYWVYDPAPRVTRDAASPSPLVSTVSSPIGSAASTLPPAPPEPRVLEPLPVPADTAAAPAPSQTPTPVRTELRTRVLAPQFREITAQKGDISWQKIARRELGDERYWSAVAKANSFLTSDRIKPGKTVIRIPLDPDNLQGRTVQVEVPVVVPPALKPAAPTAQRSATAAAAPGSQTYVILADDTLWSIAKKFYSRGSAWQSIYEANKSVITNPDRPPVGKTITIPPAPAAPSVASAH